MTKVKVKNLRQNSSHLLSSEDAKPKSEKPLTNAETALHSNHQSPATTHQSPATIR